jgi:hypothetical protein
MALYIATERKVKIAAVRSVIEAKDDEVHCIKVSSDVGEQPYSIGETIRGACNRVRNLMKLEGVSLINGSRFVGIEDGIEPFCSTMPMGTLPKFKDVDNGDGGLGGNFTIVAICEIMGEEEKWGVGMSSPVLIPFGHSQELYDTTFKTMCNKSGSPDVNNFYTNGGVSRADAVIQATKNAVMLIKL